MPEVDVNDVSPASEEVTSTSSTPNEVENDNVDMENKSDVDDKTGKEEETEWSDIMGNGQLRMKVIRRGLPDTRPQCRDICTIKLKGRLDDGKVVEEHDSLRIQLGDYEVNQGLELVIPLMNVKDEILAVVAPRFAYGSIGNPPLIPANSTITYTIELIKAEPEPDLEMISYEKRKEIADSKRERGNWWYSRQDGTKAVQCYRRALDILDENIPFLDENSKPVENTEEMIKNLIQQKLKAYNNLAAAQLMMDAYESALSSVNEVIKRDPKNVKALFRKGKILTAKGCINEAVEAMRQALAIEPENSAIKKEFNLCLKQLKIEKQHEKVLYKKMLGQDSKNDKRLSKVEERSPFWTKLLGTAITATLMAAVAFAVGYKYKNYPFV